jgi:transcriptional regulator with XRE-family HTH domain
MSDWFDVTPESQQMLSEERLILACTELVYKAMDEAGVETKQQLADLLHVSKNEVGQRLSGKRNLTVKTLAAMLHVLGKEAAVSLRPVRSAVGEDVQTISFQQPLRVTNPRAYGTTRMNIADTVTESKPLVGAA